MIHLGFKIIPDQMISTESNSGRKSVRNEAPPSTENAGRIPTSDEAREVIHAQALKCTLTEDQIFEISKAAYAVRQSIPNIREMARAIMATIIKDLTGEDADPDALYLNTFSSAVSSTTSFNGVEHTGEPNSSTSLTDLLLKNFGADRQYLQSYVERPAWQGLFQTVDHTGTVRSYVRPFSAVINRWPR